LVCKFRKKYSKATVFQKKHKQFTLSAIQKGFFSHRFVQNKESYLQYFTLKQPNLENMRIGRIYLTLACIMLCLGKHCIGQEYKKMQVGVGIRVFDPTPSGQLLELIKYPWGQLSLPIILVEENLLIEPYTGHRRLSGSDYGQKTALWGLRSASWTQKNNLAWGVGVDISFMKYTNSFKMGQQTHSYKHTVLQTGPYLHCAYVFGQSFYLGFELGLKYYLIREPIQGLNEKYLLTAPTVSLKYLF